MPAYVYAHVCIYIYIDSYVPDRGFFRFAVPASKTRSHHRSSLHISMNYLLPRTRIYVYICMQYTPIYLLYVHNIFIMNFVEVMVNYLLMHNNMNITENVTDDVWRREQQKKDDCLN